MMDLIIQYWVQEGFTLLLALIAYGWRSLHKRIKLQHLKEEQARLELAALQEQRRAEEEKVRLELAAIQEEKRIREELEREAIKLGMQALLRDRIIQQYNHYSLKQCVPIYARENIEQLYAQYTNLGGNGTITELMNKLRAMPTPCVGADFDEMDM